MIGHKHKYAGLFPVAPTIFGETGALDLDGQCRAIDFMIDAGCHGICILANFSEQFSLSDSERDLVMEAVLRQAAGRVPIIVTTSHFSSHVCAERSYRAQQAGAAMVMVLPPYHGASIRCPESSIFEFFDLISHRIDIPIMIQDAPISGTFLSADFLVRMAAKIKNVLYFKIEVPGTASKIGKMIEINESSIDGIWDGEEAITLFPDLDFGATGAMTGAGYPDGMRQILDYFTSGQRDLAIETYNRWLPLVNFENRQSGLQTAKILMVEGGIIASGAVRHPLQPVEQKIRLSLLEVARRLDPLVFRWAS